MGSMTLFRRGALGAATLLALCSLLLAYAAPPRSVLAELDERGIVVRDPERGLIDFPARSPTGRDYLLCFLDGETAIEWWHWPDAGFAGRTPLSEPPA